MRLQHPHKRILVILAFLGLFTSKLTGQDLGTQFWANYAAKVNVDDRWSWGGDAGVRGLGTNLDWYQALIRPAVNYRFEKPMSISGALAWFGTYNHNSISLNELRFHQEFNAQWPDLNAIHFFYRIRLEERFFFYRNDIPNDFKVRLRALVGVRTRDLNWFSSKRPIYFESLLEGFKTINEEEALEIFVNRARWHAAFGHRISKNFRYEIHYIYQGSTLFTSDGPESSQNIFRLRLFHNL